MSETNQSTGTPVDIDELAIAMRLRASIDGANADLVYCDENFKVFHINPAMRIMLNRYGPQMRETFPGLDPENPTGQSLDWLLRGDFRLRERFANSAMMPLEIDASFAGRAFKVHVTMIRGARANIWATVSSLSMSPNSGRRRGISRI